MTRTPFFAAMERPGRSGRIARQAGPTPSDTSKYRAELLAVKRREIGLTALTPIDADADETADEYDDDHPADPDTARDRAIADQMGAL